MRAPRELARVIHISGRAEPLLIGEKLCDIVSDLRVAYPTFNVVLVTNGIGISRLATSLSSAGLQRCTVSVHSGLSSELYDAACSLGDASIAVTLNIIITPEIKFHFDAYLGFAIRQNVSMKFFPRLRGTDPGAADIADMLSLIRNCGLGDPILDRRLNRARFLLNNDRCIDVKLDMRQRIRPVACAECSRGSFCLEGCWESIRITPWYVKPCGVREDNAYFFSEQSVVSLRERLSSGGKIPEPHEIETPPGEG
jgi:hypothetical protein